MSSPSSGSIAKGVRRAWSLIDRHERRRLQIIAIFGTLIAGLDTVALVLVYALVNLLNNRASGGTTAAVTRILHVGGKDHYRTALILLTITAVLFVVRSVLSVCNLWAAAGSAYAAEANLMSRLLVGHARAPQLMRLERNSAETLRTVLVSVDQVVLGIVLSSVSLIANGAVAVAVAVGLLLASPFVAVTVTIYFALIAFGWVRNMRRGQERRGLRVQELQKERYRLILEGIGAAKELQLRGRALFYAEEAMARTRGINAAMRVANVASGSLRYLLETSLVIGAVLVVAAAGLTGGHNSVLPAVGLVLAGAFRLLPALNQVLFLSNQVQLSQPAIRFVERELETFGAFGTVAPSAEPTTPPIRFERGLALERVSFKYPSRDAAALRGVNLVVLPGDSVGIVGPTGSGKSTLLDVILGMLEPQEGTITVDGVPLRERRDSWQRAIGYVSQSVYLVDDTLRANVALGWYGDEVDDARVAQAVRHAGLDEVVKSLPSGLDTVVGEHGVRLSGGQRQRVGIARALYTLPRVLVLDEATSNLDQATEHRIVETLADLPGDITTILVTHRADSVRRCNRILYVEDGSVRAEGSFGELRAVVPEFADWVRDSPVIPVGTRADVSIGDC